MRKLNLLLLISTLLTGVCVKQAKAESFIAPYSGNLYLQTVGGTGGAAWRLGIGTTPGNCQVFLSGPPDSSTEVFVKPVAVGETVVFCLYSTFGANNGWAFSNATDRASMVAFTDTNNSLGMGGKIIQQTRSDTWVMHLDDAVSYLFDDNNNDILIRTRLEAARGATYNFGPPSEQNRNEGFSNVTLPPEGCTAVEWNGTGLSRYLCPPKVTAPRANPEGALGESPVKKDSPAAPELTPRQIAQKAFPSVVSLLMEDSSGRLVSQGTGFFVRNNLIATNFHVIQGKARGYAELIGQKTRLDIARIAGVDQEHDLALLVPRGANAPPLELGESRQLAVGDEVYAVGSPEGFEGTLSRGIVNGIREVDSRELLLITAAISHGSSGSPVFNSRGRVIGVATSAWKDGQSLNFAVPSEYLTALIRLHP